MYYFFFLVTKGIEVLACSAFQCHDSDELRLWQKLVIAITVLLIFLLVVRLILRMNV